MERFKGFKFGPTPPWNLCFVDFNHCADSANLYCSRVHYKISVKQSNASICVIVISLFKIFGRITYDFIIGGFQFLRFFNAAITPPHTNFSDGQRCDKSHICPDHPCCATPTIVVLWGGVSDVVNHARFHQNRFRGFGSRGVEICHFPMLSGMAYITRVPEDDNASQ